MRFLLLLLTAIGCTPSLPQEAILLAAADITRTLQQTYFEEPDIVFTQVQAFDLLDQAYYKQATDELQTAGFQFVGDLEFRHISRLDLAFRTCLRTFVHREGTITAAVWHLHRSPKVDKELKAVEFETEFSDGHWLTTRNWQRNDLIPNPDRVTLQTADGKPLTALLDLHQRGIASYLADHSGVRPVEVRQVHGIIDQQRRQASQEADYRKRIRGITEQELRQLAPDGFPRQDIPRLLVEVQKHF